MDQVQFLIRELRFHKPRSMVKKKKKKKTSHVPLRKNFNLGKYHTHPKLKSNFRNRKLGDFPVVQWLRVHAPN